MRTKIIKLNLLPSECKEKLAPASRKLGLDIPRFIPISLAGLLSFLILINSLALLYGSSACRKLKEKKQNFEKVKTLAAKARQLDEELPKSRERDRYLTASVEKKLKCWKVMEQLSLSCPEQVKITDLRISRIAHGKNKLQIEGSYGKGDSLEDAFRINL